MESSGLNLKLAITGGFGQFYTDTFLRYLATTRDPCGVIIAGDESKSLRISGLMLGLAFPGLRGVTDIIAPEAPYSSLQQLGNLVYQGRTIGLVDEKTSDWTRYLVESLSQGSSQLNLPSPSSPSSSPSSLALMREHSYSSVTSPSTPYQSPHKDALTSPNTPSRSPSKVTSPTTPFQSPHMDSVTSPTSQSPHLDLVTSPTTPSQYPHKSSVTSPTIPSQSPPNYPLTSPTTTSLSPYKYPSAASTHSPSITTLLPLIPEEGLEIDTPAETMVNFDFSPDLVVNAAISEVQSEPFSESPTVNSDEGVNSDQQESYKHSQRPTAASIPPKQQTCPECNKVFLVTSMKKHLANQHPSKTCHEKCPECPKVILVTSMKRHMANNHPSKNSVVYRFPCAHPCDYVGSRPQDLTRHKVSSSCKRHMITCIFCGEVVLTGGKLTTHLYKGQCPRQFGCPDCDYRDRSNRAVKGHMKIHKK